MALTPKLWLILLCYIHLSKGTTVVKFQEDGFMTAESYIRYLGNLEMTNKVSVCFRLKIYQARTINTIFSYAIEEFFHELYISLDVQKNRLLISCCLNRFISSTPVYIALYDWLSFCFSLDLDKKSYLLVQNGKLMIIKDDSVDAEHGDRFLNGTGEVYVGQDQDSNQRLFNPFRSFSGEIAELFVFKGTLSVDEMKDFTTCKRKISQPSMLNFMNVPNEFENYNATVELNNTDNFCSHVKTFFRIFGERKNFHQTAFFCHAIGGKMVYPENEYDNKQLFNIASNSFLCKMDTTYYPDCLWLAIQVSPSNLTWQHYITGDIANFTNFHPTERKFRKDYRCVTLYACMSKSFSWHGRWLMKKCTDRRKTVCQFDGVPVFRLRGLCKKSLFDRKYILSPGTEENVFHGYFYSRIVAESEFNNHPHNHWVIRRKDKPEVTADFDRLSILDYPIGKHTWQIANDLCNVPTVELKLTICKEGQFSCNDGSCIDMAYRCDLRFNCKDGSDEIDCYPVVLPRDYSMKIPPPTVEHREANEIAILIYILNILSINVETFHISIELYIKSSWIDPRLKFKNLKDKRENNIIEDMQNVIWTPDFNLEGPSNTSCDTIDRESIFSVIKYSEPLPDNDEDISEDLIYTGEHNNIVWELKYTLSSYCQFDLVEYPFDSQTCVLNIGLNDLSPEKFQLVLEDEGIDFFGPRRLLEYEVKNISISLNKKHGQVTVEMTFRNLVLYYITSTLTPTLLILIIGYLPFYFPITAYNERIMVSVTSLLVQSSFFTEVNDSIPKTVYLKKIDTWCIFCILVLFAITVALTCINYLWEVERTKPSSVSPVMEVKKFVPNEAFSIPASSSDSYGRIPVKSKKLNTYCRIIFPASSLTFIFWYTGSALTSYESLEWT